MKRIIYVISIVADVYTLYTGVDAVSKKIIETPPFWVIALIWMILIFTVSYALMYTLLMLMRNRCIKCGTHNIPCSIMAYFHAKCQNRTQTSIKMMQGLYKKMVQSRQIIKKDKQRYSNINSRKEIIEDFLVASRETLKKSLFVNVRISLKTFCQKGNNNILQTYTYVIENLDDNKRTKKIDYILSLRGTDTYQDLRTWHNASKSYSEEHGRTPFASNSIFNYLVATGKLYWLSNDLDEDEKNGIFHTSSEYRNLYNSLGVFLIKSPVEVEIPKSGIKGVLTFDSSRTNIFVERECQLLMGFITYCVYELLEDV